MGWQITVQGVTVRHDDVTVGEATTVQQIVGRAGWDITEPTSAPDVLGAWCVIAVMRTGKTVQEAIMAINGVPLIKLAACLSELPDVPLDSNGQVDEAALDALREMAANAANAKPEG